MIPRPYQESAVAAMQKETANGGGTMVSIATGGGKTAIAGFYLAAERHKKALVLQHTEELIAQNRATIQAITGRTTSVVKADRDEWFGDTVFASVATLARDARRARMPVFSHLVADECHRAAAPGYRAAIDACLERNPNLRYVGLTATPGRGDGRSLREIFPSLAYTLSVGRLIDMGVLVPPTAYTIDIESEMLAGLSSRGGEFDMDEAARILNRGVHNDSVVQHWLDKAGNRRTVVFCTTVEHAYAVCSSFGDHGVKAEVVSAATKADERRAILGRLERGATRVVVNCMVLTEGFDLQVLGCIVILRPMAHHGTLIQAIGRGLRMVDLRKYPGEVKTDCIVLDFAGALARHGSLEMMLADDVAMAEAQDRDDKPAGEEDKLGEVDAGDLFGAALSDFTMREISIISASPFGWSETANGVMVASGFAASAFVVKQKGNGGMWHAIGKLGARDGELVPLAAGDRSHAIAAADDFMRQNETAGAAKKSRAWMRSPATDRQVELLRLKPDAPTPLRYEASCKLAWKFNRSKVSALTKTAA